MATFDSASRALNDACELALKYSTTAYYHDLMTEAVFRSAGMIGYNPDLKIQSKRKTNASMEFGSIIFSPDRVNMSLNSREFSATYREFI